MTQNHSLEETAYILNSVSSYNRLYTFLNIEDKEPKHIADDLDLTRNALQHYIEDWKDIELIETKGNKYLYTEKGERVREFLEEFG